MPTVNLSERDNKETLFVKFEVCLIVNQTIPIREIEVITWEGYFSRNATDPRRCCIRATSVGVSMGPWPTKATMHYAVYLALTSASEF